MGFSWKPWAAVTAVALGVAVLICVSVGAYHWKRTEFIPSEPYYYESRVSRETDNVTLDSEDYDLTSTTEGLELPSIVEVALPPCNGTPWECNIRLNPQVYPLHYDVYLNPETVPGIFVGRVAIVLNVSTEVDHIRLHSRGLNITHVGLDMNKTSLYALNESFAYEPNEFFVILPRENLLPNKYNLIIEFRGNLTRGIIGLYSSNYYDPVVNHTKRVIATKFQPTYARRAFPCFDEPSFKSTFSVSVVKPTNYTALSNMPVSEEETEKPLKGYTIVHFEKSVKMVTYLVAVAIGEFDYTISTTKRGVSVKVYATAFQAAKTEYATKLVPKMIDFYEDYFKIKYPLPKMDIVGIPDFVSGAMEHWGMISFRESNLLYQPGVSSARNKQRIASVLAHEIAHMWFGNLVTLKWWDDLWLNEGFASYMEYKAVNVTHPEWDMESQFVSQDMAPVLALDGKMSSHKIIQPVLHPDQITEIFDSISYNKGSSVIRMLEHFLNPVKFQRGVVRFLKTFSYQNAVTNDLWENLQAEVSPDTNISLLMDTWTKQMGYPVIRVRVAPGLITVRQERFLENPKAAYNRSESPFGYRWEIPFRVFPGGGNDSYKLGHALMHYTQETMQIPTNHHLKWAKLNSGQYGYFRVKYEDQVWRNIKVDYLKSFEPKERCGLMDDVWALAYARYIEYDVALDFGQAIRLDEHVVPWDCLDGHLLKVSALLENSAPDTYALYRRYVLSLTSDLYRNYTWTEKEEDPHLDRLLKTKILSLSCAHGHVYCLQVTKKLFSEWINKGTEISSGLRPIVYKWGMWQNGEEVWNKVWDKFVHESDSQERVRLLAALGSSQEPFVLRRFVSFARNETLIRRQDYFTAMRYVASNPIGNSIVWSTYRNDYESLIRRFSTNDRYFGRMILDITSDFSSPIQLQEMQTFFALYPEAGAGRRARQTALEKVQNNIEWSERNVPVIDKWLKKEAGLP